MSRTSCSKEMNCFSKAGQFDCQNAPCDSLKKMNTHTLCFYTLISKLKAFGNLKWAQESLWKKQRTPNFTGEKTLYLYFMSENMSFEIYILSNFYIPIFHPKKVIFNP